MDLDQDAFERIDRFLDGTMELDERNAFFELMNNDSSFKEEVELQFELRRAIQIKSSESLKESLNLVRDNVRKEKGGAIRRRLILRLSIAAMFFILIGFLGLEVLFKDRIPEGYALAGELNLEPTYVSATRSISFSPPKDDSQILVKVLRSNSELPEALSYTYNESEIIIYSPKIASFEAKNLSVIFYENEKGREELYLKQNIKLYKILKTIEKVQLIESTDLNLPVN